MKGRAARAGVANVTLGTLLLACAGVQAHGQAAPAAPPRAASAPESQRIVIEGRAERSPDDIRRQAIGSLTVIGRDELDEYGDTSILDVLQRVPGVSIEGEVPRLRGLGAGYTRILVNGEPAPPGFSLDTLAPADIERIEVVKGPSAEHGGVAGIINVILRVPPRLRQREARATLGYRALRPQGSASLSWADRAGELGFGLPLTAYTWANEGEGESARRSRLPDGAVRDDAQASRDRWAGGGLNFGPRAEWKRSEEESLSLQGFFQRNESRSDSERATTVISGPPVGNVLDRSTSRGSWDLARAQVQWVHKTPEGRRAELKAGVQSTLGRSAGTGQGTDASGAALTRRDNLSSNREAGATLGARWRQPLPGPLVQTLAAGVDLERRERRELRRLLENGTERFDGSIGVPFFASVERLTAFVQDEFEPTERTSLLLGLRLEEIRTFTAGNGKRFENRHRAASPVLQWRQALDAHGRDVLRASFARSQRLPDIGTLMPRYAFNGAYEREVPNTPLAPDSAGNPLLAAEKATVVDLGVETYLEGGGVLSASVFHRRIDELIRRRSTLETVPEAPVPRWVSRPGNFGAARSTGAQLELKGRGEQLLPALFEPRSGWMLRASLALYRSRIEQLDDPDARLEGQAPWSANVGFDRRVPSAIVGYGASVAFVPAFSTQQTDRQRVWRSASRRFDAYVSWRFDRQTQLRVAAVNLGAPDSRSTSRIEDTDGFVSSSRSRRTNTMQASATLTHRF